ncbi:MAG: hypothetical protein M5T61_16820 [Acidimicrobiia bacterium]|nr:hypothetical protein [Acidimicrobiia bacterium]
MRAHIERRYGAEFDPPGPRMLDYLHAVKACFAAFRTGELSHHGDYTTCRCFPRCGHRARSASRTPG